MHKVNGTVYQVGNSGKLTYPVSGCSMDWAHGEAKIPYVYTFELPPAKKDVSVENAWGFELPEDKIIQTGQEVWKFHETVAFEVIKEFSP